ncbi:hypothetical protein FOY51_25565 [Antrihabitans cavernicola]|uniref:Biotin-protein ligase N-terminal domain-containing protein n=1 Tax=Antrihabitans cavernicola TaxID=2495913 RepID=A0A5A7S487_9NOCA|nr:hypothetical protein FOY51_25565 [Spelaeibacter cavernicola]
MTTHQHFDPPGNRPVALVYRGPASCAGCSEAVANLLQTSPTPFRTVFCGPDEATPLTAANLANATVYAQPGGGTLAPAWRKMRGHADDLRAWVRGGGHYLGFCLGAYLAGPTSGFGLVPGDIERYIDSDNATVHNTDDTVIAIRWRNQPRHMFFQDGPTFPNTTPATTAVPARYDNDLPAAVITTYGTGRVGLVGPHPEADPTWYTGIDLTNPDGIRYDLGHDLIESTLHPTPNEPAPAG